MTLDSVARRDDAIVNDRGVTVDTSLCPTREKICQLQQDGKRANSRRVLPWTNAEQILRGPVRDALRCMKFKCQAQAAQQRSEGFLWHAAATTPQMLDDVVKYMGNGMLIDGKWRLCEDKVVMDGMLIFKKIDSTTHDNVEFQTGFKMMDSRFAGYSFANGGGQYAIRDNMLSLQRCMPCDDPNCEHKLATRDTGSENGSGYEMYTECSGTKIAFKPPVRAQLLLSLGASAFAGCSL
jgi:hypothetical protein